MARPPSALTGANVGAAFSELSKAVFKRLEAEKSAPHRNGDGATVLVTPVQAPSKAAGCCGGGGGAPSEVAAPIETVAPMGPRAIISMYAVGMRAGSPVALVS